MVLLLYLPGFASGCFKSFLLARRFNRAFQTFLDFCQIELQANFGFEQHICFLVLGAVSETILGVQTRLSVINTSFVIIILSAYAGIPYVSKILILFVITRGVMNFLEANHL